MAALTRTKRSRTAKRFFGRLPLNIAVGVLIIIEVYPLIWILLGSFKTQKEVLGNPFWALPQQLNLDNYTNAFEVGNLGQYLLNSVITVFPALLLALVLGVAAGFALEVMVWKGRGGVLLLFVLGILIPGQLVLLPLFTIYFRLHLTGTLWPLVITYVAGSLPLIIFMVATYFRAVPREIFEAATLDGASLLRALWSVGIPMIRNAIVTVALVQFFFLWNDLLIALTFTNSTALRTLQVGLLNFRGQYGEIQYGPTFAAIFIGIAGPLLIYLFLNQRIMRGMAAGSLKG